MVVRAIQLGVHDGAFGLVMGEGDVTPHMLRYQETLPLGVISFEPGFSLLARATCEALLAQWRAAEESRRRQEEDLPPESDETPVAYDEKESNGDRKIDETDEEDIVEKTVYHHVRLVIQDVLASRIADVNRGIFMPLSAVADEPLTFTLTLEVNSEEGITPATLENKVKETIRQIGARITEEKKG